MTDSDVYGEPIHTYPVNDLIEHVLEGDDCPCGPDTVPVPRDDGSMAWQIVHHSLDGREHSEPDHDRAACPGCAAIDAGEATP